MRDGRTGRCQLPLEEGWSLPTQDPFPPPEEGASTRTWAQATPQEAVWVGRPSFVLLLLFFHRVTGHYVTSSYYQQSTEPPGQRQGFTKEERAGSCSQQQVGGSAHQTGFSRGWRSLEGPGVDCNHTTIAGKSQEQQKSSQWKEESRWDEGGGLLILVKPYFGKQARESTQGSG